MRGHIVLFVNKMKLERLLSITFMLLNKDIVSAGELAGKFQVSQRTIYRDIEAICAAGIPVISYQGSNGGYGIMEGYKIDKRFLRAYDVESIVTVLKGVASIFDDEKYNETLDTFKGISQSDESEKLVIDFGGGNIYRQLLNDIRMAIAENKVVAFSYTNTKGNTEHRLVEPLTIVLKYGSWYLYGFCRVRRDFRIFRLSRMHDFHIKQESFVMEKEKVKELQFSFVDDDNIEYIDIELRFASKALARAFDIFYAEEKVFNEDETVTIKLYNHPKDQWIYNTILSFADEVEVIYPEDLRKTIKEKAKKIYNLYKEKEV